MTDSKTALSLKPGTEVLFKGQRGHITHQLDFESVLVTNASTGKPEPVRIADLRIAPLDNPASAKIDPQTVPDENWRKAQERFEIIRPLLESPGRRRVDVEARAAEFGLHANTLYKWIGLYDTVGRITAFLPRGRSDKGSIKLSPEVEAIIEATIQDEYLTKQRKHVSKVCLIAQKRCKTAGLPVPHGNTVRNRIAKLSEELKLSKRYSSKDAEEKFSPVKGHFPSADYPLSVIQIDHTKLDIILVDDIHRRPIGRPWITLAIDVYSRMVTGFYVSFDPPGALSTGLCLAHSILPKEVQLAKMGIAAEWPVWGFPAKVLADNAKEFRGSMFKRACEQYGVYLEWRPVGRPHFGGHIERYLGTLLKEIHSLPGTTFSNIQERKDYDSDGTATLTLSEFENWLTTYIANVYHRRVHSTIGMSPLDKYREGIFGGNGKPGTGLPPKIIGETRLRLDFMPYVERTVQDYGVVIDDVHYYSDVMRRWINATEPNNPKVKRKFLFRRDPRDISVIWFYDPELCEYYQIPYRNTSHPAISLWELQEAKRATNGKPKDEEAEQAIFEAYDRMRKIEDEAKGKTKAVRRAVQRRKQGPGQMKSNLSPTNVLEAKPEPIVAAVPTTLQPFEDLDEMSDD
jgi:putative transposase